MSTANESPRRPVVGVMTGSFHTDYSRQITEAICRHLKNAQMDIYIFQGLDASRFLNIEGYVDKGFDDHYYSQFEYSRFIRPDLIVASVGTISAVRNPLSASAFRAILPGVPVIALEIEEEIENGVHIFLDNYQGMCGCMEHLIRDHGCRKILFVSGPKGVADAEKRLHAYRDTMARHGFPVTEDMIAYGNFTDHIDTIIEGLLKNCPRPDAIVCANDDMAESACRVLRAHGLRPGEDVAVTGFDDNAAAAMMNPPLTTVQQPKEVIARIVVDIARAYLRGETPESVTLPGQLVLRESCGCRVCIAQSAPHPSAGNPSVIMEDRQVIKRLFNESILTSLMLRNLLNQNINVHTFFRKLGEALHHLGAAYSWIALLSEPLAMEDGRRLRLPDTLRLHMVQEKDKVQYWSRKDAPVLSAQNAALAASLRTDADGFTAIFPLFYENMHYGVFAVKLTLDEMVYFYTISQQIGTGLRYLFMALDEQAARAALEEKNQILKFSATHDGLTGLYNRVGIMQQIYEYIHTHGQEEQYVAFMADLDHLKQINDNFGHSMGDMAIRKAAEILCAALPAGTPLGRSGGDEFMAIFQADGEDAAERVYERVKEACRSYNARNEIPFYEELSVGSFLFAPRSGADVPEFFRQADERLYLDKEKRRKSILRAGQ